MSIDDWRLTLTVLIELEHEDVTFDDGLVALEDRLTLPLGCTFLDDKGKVPFSAVVGKL